MKKIDYCTVFLENAAIRFRNIYRGLRNIYKWSPVVVNEILVYEILRIFNETEEDNKDGSSSE